MGVGYTEPLLLNFYTLFFRLLTRVCSAHFYVYPFHCPFPLNNVRALLLHKQRQMGKKATLKVLRKVAATLPKSIFGI
jgi:hypothetical protein